MLNVECDGRRLTLTTFFFCSQLYISQVMALTRKPLEHLELPQVSEKCSSLILVFFFAVTPSEPYDFTTPRVFVAPQYFGRLVSGGVP